MTGDTDFVALYRELGVDPDDGIIAFRNAYRRRVADIHPDRAVDNDSTQLQRLNGMYAAAVRFERDYGRLPGAAAPRPKPSAPSVGVASSSASVVPTAAPRSGGRRWYLLALAIVLAVVALRVRDEPEPSATWPEVGETVVAPTGESAQSTPMLALGMSVADVLAIQGAPVATDGNRWLYGPSWVRFQCLELADWHSSPLYVLKTATSQPPAQALRQHRPSRLENCDRIALP